VRDPALETKNPGEPVEMSLSCGMANNEGWLSLNLFIVFAGKQHKYG
jgi:hypothetical protein